VVGNLHEAPGDDPLVDDGIQIQSCRALATFCLWIRMVHVVLGCPTDGSSMMAVELGVMKPILIADIIDSEGQGTYHIRVSLTSRVTVTQRWFEGMSDVAGQISNSMSMTSCFFFIG